MTPQRDRDNRRWTSEGTVTFLDALDRIPDDELAGPTALAGWTGRHLVAHVAANADALLNLAHWAATGTETPMYSSPEQRSDDIRAGAQRPAGELREWARESAARLEAALDALTEEQWARQVRTAQGRLVPATEIPWLRAREVMVHAVDLGCGLGFQDLPESFLLALVDDILARRSGGDQPSLVLEIDGGTHTRSLAGRGEPTTVRGSLPQVAAYLAGRPASDLTSSSQAVPDLPPWL